MLGYHQITSQPFVLSNSHRPSIARRARLFLDSPSPVRKRIAKGPQAKCREHAQANRKWLSALDGARNGAPGENNRCEQGELGAVSRAVLYAQTAEDVQGADRDASDY